jgi:hypothetical protein
MNVGGATPPDLGLKEDVPRTLEGVGEACGIKDGIAPPRLVGGVTNGDGPPNTLAIGGEVATGGLDLE